jgi:hypothetical protein
MARSVLVLARSMAANSLGRRARASARPRTIVVDTAVEVREEIVRQLAADGYQSIATASMDVVCTLVQTGQVDLVLINLSAFPADALRRLGLALAARRQVRLYAMAMLISAERTTNDPDDPAARTPWPRARGRMAARWLHRPSAETTALAPRRHRPN